MGFSDKVFKTLYRAGSRLLLGSGDNADWIHEKVQRPGNVLALARNMACYYLQLPLIPEIFNLTIEPVFGCNLRCRYCFCWGESAPELTGLRPDLMPWPLFRKAIDEAPNSLEAVTFVGMGEPLLHPRFSEMADYCADRGLRSIVYTNGTLLTGGVLERLAASRLSVLTVSVEADAEASREFRGVDNAVIRRNLERFIELKRPETEVKLSIVAHEKNADRFENARREWGALVTNVKANPRMGYEGSGSPPVCMEPWRGNVLVLTDGQVSPCCLDCKPDLVIGNLNEQSLGEILQGDAFHELIQRIISGNAPDRCVKCSEFSATGLPRKAPKRKPRRSG
ncbi:MAG TPA: radical SAM protein [bacterium]|nr:radical SAM protein [bacterium]